MKLSIVIPAYNEEKNIGKCSEELCRVVGDKYRAPLVVIVVNDFGRGIRSR
jgi:glycosyltransferase involved in cell wall biosynthesis